MYNCLNISFEFNNCFDFFFVVSLDCLFVYGNKTQFDDALIRCGLHWNELYSNKIAIQNVYAKYICLYT